MLFLLEKRNLGCASIPFSNADADKKNYSFFFLEENHVFFNPVGKENLGYASTLFSNRIKKILGFIWDKKKNWQLDEIGGDNGADGDDANGDDAGANGGDSNGGGDNGGGADGGG